MLKDLVNWKEVPLDCLVLSLYQLQAFYYNEAKRGISGIGEYTIDDKYRSLPIPQVSTDYFMACSPDEIVRRIKEGQQTMHEKFEEDNKHDDKVAAEKKVENCDTTGRYQSIHVRAQSVLKADNISFDTKLHCFNIKGLSGVTRVVTLFPKETCSCPSTGMCYHIVAAKLGVGIPFPVSDKTQHNFTQLRRNTRSRKDKRSGRKRPRPNDIDIVQGILCIVHVYVNIQRLSYSGTSLARTSLIWLLFIQTLSLICSNVVSHPAASSVPKREIPLVLYQHVHIICR